MFSLLSVFPFLCLCFFVVRVLYCYYLLRGVCCFVREYVVVVTRIMMLYVVLLSCFHFSYCMLFFMYLLFLCFLLFLLSLLL